jgi:hypothetical protein
MIPTMNAATPAALGTLGRTTSAPTWCTFWSAQVKGRVLLDTIGSMKARLGVAELERLMSTLEEPIRELLEGSILASEWYPLSAMTTLLEAAIETFDGGDEEVLVRRAQAVVAKELTGAYSSLVRIGSPEFIVKRVAVIHETYFQNVTVSLRVIAANRATLRYNGFHPEHRLVEAVIRGFYLKALELSGARSVSACFTIPIEAARGYAEIEIAWT